MNKYNSLLLDELECSIAMIRRFGGNLTFTNKNTVRINTFLENAVDSADFAYQVIKDEIKNNK